MPKTKNKKRSNKVSKMTNAAKRVANEIKLDFIEGATTVGAACSSVAKAIGPELGKVGKAARDGFSLGIEMVKGAYNGATNVIESSKRK